MLKYGNEEFRNLQEQVGKNKDDITSLKQGGMGHEPIPGPQGEQGPQGPQGPKGNTGASIYGMAQYLPSASAYARGDFFLLSNGNLYKKIENSWVLQGSLRGPQGPQGEDGDEVTANPQGTASGGSLSKIKIDGIIYSISGGGSGELTPEALAEILEGSETVVVDFNLEGDKLEVRLDNDYKNICDRALMVPMSAPAEHKLVGIDTSNGEELIGIGNGLALSNGSLIVSGGGGGGALYIHVMTLELDSNYNTRVTLAFYSTRQSEFTQSSELSDLDGLYALCSGPTTYHTNYGSVYFLSAEFGPVNVNFRFVGVDSSSFYPHDGYYSYSNITIISDTVKEL